MNSNRIFSGKPRAVAVASVILLIPALIVFMVNLEIAIKVFAPSWKLFEVILPAWVFRTCVLISVDLSTVSTFVPLLLILFPLVQSLKAMKGRLQPPAAGNEWMPYPPHFAYFLIMFGLFGTLYGLIIGLGSSGVEGFIAYRPTTDSISRALTRLLAGTATALWSSLIGLVGAFLAAQPIPWLFRRLTGIVRPPETVSLAHTIHALTIDLRNLGEASRELRNTLSAEAISGFLAKIDGIELALRNLTNATERTTAAIEQLSRDRLQELETLRQQTAELKEISSRIQPLETIRDTGRQTLGRMDELQNGFAKLTALLSGWTQHLAEANDAARQTASTASRIAGDLPAHSLGIQQKLEGIVESNRANLRELREERDAFRRSIAAYIKHEETEKTRDNS